MRPAHRKFANEAVKYATVQSSLAHAPPKALWTVDTLPHNCPRGGPGLEWGSKLDSKKSSEARTGVTNGVAATATANNNNYYYYPCYFKSKCILYFQCINLQFLLPGSLRGRTTTAACGVAPSGGFAVHIDSSSSSAAFRKVAFNWHAGKKDWPGTG